MIGKLTRFMEHWWLAVAMGSAIWALIVLFREGMDAAGQWLLFPAIALAMFFFRRFTRRKLEAMEERGRE